MKARATHSINNNKVQYGALDKIRRGAKAYTRLPLLMSAVLHFISNTKQDR